MNLLSFNKNFLTYEYTILLKKRFTIMDSLAKGIVRCTEFIKHKPFDFGPFDGFPKCSLLVYLQLRGSGVENGTTIAAHCVIATTVIN